MQRIISNQLKSFPNHEKGLRIAYYSPTPGKEIHMDTGFWQPSGEPNQNLVPILIIVDVATRFTKIFVQTRKNENIEAHFKTFIKELKRRFPKQVSKKHLLITDGARELSKPFKESKTVIHKVSTGINKAVLAETKIRQMRAILRDVEAKLNVNNIANNRHITIDAKILNNISSSIEAKINKNAAIRPRPTPPKNVPPVLRLGTPVFAINLHKHFPFQTKDVLRKKSYDQNWYYEHFFISRIITFNGISKYEITAYDDLIPVKYYFYYDMLQPIDPSVSAEYITKYLHFHKTRQNTNFF